MLELAVPFAPHSDNSRYVRKDRLPYALLSFRGRKIDLSRPVQVYRNLRGKKGSYFSIRQGGCVVAHGDAMMLRDATFVVQEAGRQRVLSSGRKNVHAWVRGYLTPSGCGTSHDRDDLPCEIHYNPRKNRHFVDYIDRPVQGAEVVLIRPKKISAAYVDWVR